MLCNAGTARLGNRPVLVEGLVVGYCVGAYDATNAAEFTNAIRDIQLREVRRAVSYVGK